MKTGIFYAVGVGTEPLDLTLRAKQVLETAEVLVTPITRAGEPSAAARIAEQVVSFSGKEIIPLLFPMQKHLDYRERLRGELLQPVRDCLQAGKRVAMVTLGDVSIYSTAAYVQQVLEEDGYATEVVAGISAFSAGAAKAKCSLCERQESLLVLPGGAAPETIQQALEQFDTLVLMKAGKALPWLVPGTAVARTYYHAAKYRHGRGMDWNANRRADLLFYHPHHPPSAEQIEKGNRNNGLFCRSWSR